MTCGRRCSLPSASSHISTLPCPPRSQRRSPRHPTEQERCVRTTIGVLDGRRLGRNSVGVVRLVGASLHISTSSSSADYHPHLSLHGLSAESANERQLRDVELGLRGREGLGISISALHVGRRMVGQSVGRSVAPVASRVGRGGA